MASVTIHTTQNVSIDYETAEVGRRIGGFLIDLLIIFASYALIAYLAVLADIEISEQLLFAFIPLFYFIGYFFFWELITRGHTPGKLIVKVRVIRLDGRDPTPADYIGRALFLLPDVLFTFGLQAVLLVATTARNQRLGDIVANTAVIKTKFHERTRLAQVLSIESRADYEPVFPAVQSLSENDMLIVKETLLRAERFRNQAHLEAVNELAGRLVEALDVVSTERPMTATEFLNTLLKDYIVLTR